MKTERMKYRGAATTGGLVAMESRHTVERDTKERENRRGARRGARRRTVGNGGGDVWQGGIRKNS